MQLALDHHHQTAIIALFRKVNRYVGNLAPFLSEGGTPAQYGAGLNYAILQGWLWRHESGTYVKFTPAGAEMFA